MEVREMASFVMANVDLLSEFDLKDVYCAAMRERAKSDYGVYIDKSEFNINMTYQENWERYFQNKIAKKFKDVKEYCFYQDFCSFGKHIHRIEGDVLYTSSMKVYELVYILLYVVLGEIDKDLARANEIESNSGLRYDIANYKNTNFGYFGNIQVRKYNDGRITIYGLNEEQKARLKYVYEVSNRRV